MKKLVPIICLFLLVTLLSFAGGASETGAEAGKKASIEFISQLPEYEGRYQAVWEKFMEDNPNIDVKVIVINDQDFKANIDPRLAAGTAPEIWGGNAAVQNGPTVDNYKKYLDLTDIYEHWDLLPGGKDEWLKNSKLELGKDVPGIYGVTFEMTHWWSYIYHSDLAEEAGLGDKYSVKTVDDLREWLAGWKKYNDANGLLTPLDLGTGACGAWCAGQEYYQVLMSMEIENLDKLDDVYTGKAKFTDSEWKWYFEWYKEMMDKGWLSQNWWTKGWELDMEANIISKRVPALLHGPWMWQKLEQADPDVQLSGFPVPTKSGKNRRIKVDPLVPSKYTWVSPANVVNRESFKTGAYQKAINYWAGPESVKMQVEDWGELTIMKFDEPLEVASPQWKHVGSEIGKEGPWSDVVFDFNAWGISQKPHLVAGEADPVTGGQFLLDLLVPYLKGAMTVEQAQQKMQDQLKKAYDNM